MTRGSEARQDLLGALGDLAAYLIAAIGLVWICALIDGVTR